MSDGDRVALTLVCAVCGAEQEIVVPRKRGVPAGRYFWECFECQGSARGAEGNRRPREKGARKTRRNEPSDTEGK